MNEQQVVRQGDRVRCKKRYAGDKEVVATVLRVSGDYVDIIFGPLGLLKRENVHISFVELR